jgi:hypothetical protein
MEKSVMYRRPRRSMSARDMVRAGAWLMARDTSVALRITVVLI